MPYRRTPHVARKQAARQQAIVGAARDAALEGGMAAVQVAQVAERAGIATGTVYRYFPSKADLITAVIGGRDQVSPDQLALPPRSRPSRCARCGNASWSGR
jgi:AcrR family transcriptional regulator